MRPRATTVVPSRALELNTSLIGLASDPFSMSFFVTLNVTGAEFATKPSMLCVPICTITSVVSAGSSRSPDITDNEELVFGRYMSTCFSGVAMGRWP
jgi:hypothetical protein